MIRTYATTTLIRREAEIHTPLLKQLLVARIAIGAQIVVNAPPFAAMGQRTGGSKEAGDVLRILIDIRLLVAQLQCGHGPTPQLFAINAAAIEMGAANTRRPIHFASFESEIMTPLLLLLLARGKGKQAGSTFYPFAAWTAPYTALELRRESVELDLEKYIHTYRYGNILNTQSALSYAPV